MMRSRGKPGGRRCARLASLGRSPHHRLQDAHRCLSLGHCGRMARLEWAVCRKKILPTPQTTHCVERGIHRWLRGVACRPARKQALAARCHRRIGCRLPDRPRAPAAVTQHARLTSPESGRLPKATLLLRRQPIQPALAVILDQPQRAIRRLLNGANTEANRPVLGRCRGRAMHLDPVQGTADEPGRERRAFHFGNIAPL